MYNCTQRHREQFVSTNILKYQYVGLMKIKISCFMAVRKVRQNWLIYSTTHYYIIQPYHTS